MKNDQELTMLEIIGENDEDLVVLNGLKKISYELNGKNPEFDLAVNKLNKLLIDKHVESVKGPRDKEILCDSKKIIQENSDISTIQYLLMPDNCNTKTFFCAIVTTIGVSVVTSIATILFIKIIKKLF